MLKRKFLVEKVRHLYYTLMSDTDAVKLREVNAYGCEANFAALQKKKALWPGKLLE